MSTARIESNLQQAFDRGMGQVLRRVLPEQERRKAEEQAVDFFERTIDLLSSLSGDIFERMGEVYKNNVQGDHFYKDGDESRFLLVRFNHHNFVDIPLLSRSNHIHEGFDRQTQCLDRQVSQHMEGIWERDDLRIRVIHKLDELNSKVSQAGFKVMVEHSTHNATLESSSEASAFPRKIWLVKKEPAGEDGAVTFKELKTLLSGETITLTLDHVSNPRFRAEFNGLLATAPVKVDWYYSQGAIINDDGQILLAGSAMVQLERSGDKSQATVKMVEQSEIDNFLFETPPD